MSTFSKLPLSWIYWFLLCCAVFIFIFFVTRFSLVDDPDCVNCLRCHHANIYHEKIAPKSSRKSKPFFPLFSHLNFISEKEAATSSGAENEEIAQPKDIQCAVKGCDCKK